MIRAAALLIACALACALWLMLETEAPAAMAFTFVGSPLLVAGVALYGWSQLRPVRMTPDERALHALAFRDLRPRDFVRLVELGEWREAEGGEVLFRSGDEVGAVMVLLSGRVAFERDGEEIAEIGPGEMLGSATMLVGGPAWGSAVARSPARYLSLARAEVQPWIEKNPTARIALQATVSRDLAAKLRRLTDGGT